MAGTLAVLLLLTGTSIPEAPDDLVPSPRRLDNTVYSTGPYGRLVGGALPKGEKEYSIGAIRATFSWGTSWGEWGIRMFPVPGLLAGTAMMAYASSNRDDEYAPFVILGFLGLTALSFVPQPYVKFSSKSTRSFVSLIVDLGVSGGMKVGYSYLGEAGEFHITGGLMLAEIGIGWPYLLDMNAAFIPLGAGVETTFGAALTSTTRLLATGTVVAPLVEGDEDVPFIAKGGLALRKFLGHGSVLEVTAGVATVTGANLAGYVDLRYMWFY